MDTTTAFQENYGYTPDEITEHTAGEFHKALASVRERFNALSKNTTLIINHPEAHFSPLEKAHQIALMNAIHEDGINLICGQELYHNGLFRHFTGEHYPEALGYTNPLEGGMLPDNSVFQNTTAEDAMKLEIANHGRDKDVDCAINSFYALYRFLIQRGIRNEFLDVTTRKPNGVFTIDHDDPATGAVIESLGYGNKKPLTVFDKENAERHRMAMHTRNVFMAQKVSKIVAEMEGGIFYFPQGSLHTTGNNTFPYEESLEGLLAFQGHEIHTLWPFYHDEPATKPSNVTRSEIAHLYAEFRTAQFESGAEQEVLKTVLPAMGVTDPIWDHQSYKPQYEAEIETKFMQWVEELGLRL